MSKKYIITLIGLLSVFIAEFFDLFVLLFNFTPAQEIAFVILIVTATLWISEFVPLFITSFIIILLQTTWLLPAIHNEGGQLAQQAFLSPFFSNIILLFLGGFTLSSVLHKYGLDKLIAKLIIGKTGDNPSRFLLSIILISAFFSMWMSNTATAAMMFAIVLPIIYQDKKNNFGKALALSIPFACNIGGLGTPIGTPPNAIAISYLSKIGVNISFAEWMLIAIPIVLILLVFLWRLMIKFFPPIDIRIDMEMESKRPLLKKHFLIIAIFVLTCGGWLTTDFHGLPTGIISLLPIIACFGLKLLDTGDFRSLSWDIIFMLGGGLTLGVGLKESGLAGEIVKLIPQGIDFWILLVIMGIIAVIMSTFISNTATANLVIPLAVAIDYNLSFLVVTVAMMCSGAMSLPVTTPPNAIAFGSGVLQSKDMLKYGTTVTLVAFLVILLMAKFCWSWLGIF